MEIKPFDDTYFMKQALVQAKKAYDKDEVPVGAIIVCDNQIIARAYNYTEALNILRPYNKAKKNIIKQLIPGLIVQTLLPKQ